MTTPDRAPAPRSPIARFFRRAAAAVVIGLLFYSILWYAVFDATTSALVASGGALVLVTGASVSETFQSIFETIAEFVLGIVGAIADAVSSIFD